MNVNKEKVAMLRQLLATLVAGMAAFGDVASPGNKKQAAVLRADIEREIAELEAGPSETTSHGHPESDVVGNINDPEAIIEAIAETTRAMFTEHAGSTPIGFSFVLVHEDKAKTGYIVHGASGGDSDVVTETFMRRVIKDKLGLDD